MVANKSRRNRGPNKSFSDDSDISTEIKTLFTRTSVLCRRYKRRSLSAKVFRSCCVCFYDIALWPDFTVLNVLDSLFDTHSIGA